MRQGITINVYKFDGDTIGDTTLLRLEVDLLLRTTSLMFSQRIGYGGHW